MKLLELTLENFKGVQKFSFAPQGDNCKIYGANGTGKTTLADAYFWLLFGKDSNGNTNFSIKTNGTQGLNYSVTGSFEIDDKQTVTLCRTLKEKWERRRGEAERRLTGNTTNYYIDGVPKKQKEYQEFVASLCNEEIFNLITRPENFASTLHWQKRRDILINAFAGETDDNTVISNHPELKELGKILDSLSVSDFAAKAIADRNKVNKRLKELPIEINAYNNTICEINAHSNDFNKDKLQLLNEKKSKLETDLHAIMNGTQKTELQQQLAEAKREYAEKHAAYISSGSADNTVLQNEITDINKNVFKLSSQVADMTSTISINETKIAKRIGQGKALNSEYKAISSTAFNGDTICPACKQQLPEYQIAEAEALFNKNKSEHLEQIINNANSLKKEIGEIKAKNKELSQDIIDIKKQITDGKYKISELKSRLTEATPFEQTTDGIALQTVIDDISEKINQLSSNDTNVLIKLNSDITQVENDIKSMLQVKARLDQLRLQQSLIAKCEAEQKELTKLLVQRDKEIDLTQQFTRLKAQDIEQNINNKFKLVKFKLFRELVNGGIEDCCEATVNGISFNDGLNTASRVNAGLDIINILSGIYGVSVPIWIDNAESITNFIDGKQQRIYLTVSENDTILRSEKE